MSDQKHIGRPKNSLNKTTSSGREAIWKTFRALGDVEAMTKWAKKNPTEFYTRIFTRMLPLDVRAKVVVSESPDLPKTESDREFAKKLAFLLNAGLHDDEPLTLENTH